ncbi:DUF3048 domain-containing protein [Anaeromicrobium sediminis]|uniref:Lipoprotein YerB n=1 Tax=Anaeromicrobium sediminis TaxID=1478221 RepID=A0A267MHN8_9FIRM|nr:DUF3048 domain-containing protein [Anaeromicrobium sediminis]PAB58922.1 hypothetical protein CCE28_12115 [Anaeromicrobium sediminis]
MKKFIILTIIMGSLAFSGCTKEEKVVETVKEKEPIVEVEKEEIKKEEPVVEVIEEKFLSPISHMECEEDQVNNRPFAVMLDNQVHARPQAGLDQAEIVYEILAEGNITRYMAIFATKSPELIGPVRSARPYFIDKALEYDALYVHDGGSPQALDDIVRLKMADISAQSRGKSTFWRKSHKKRPHNEYTSADAIRKAANGSNYKKTVNIDTWKYYDKDTSINGSELKNIDIPYSKNYKVTFKYNEDTKLYDRYINNKPHVDEASKTQLTAENIIVQRASKKVLDSVGRLKVGLVGTGEGIYITNGEMKEVTWKKESRRSITRFFYKNGEEINLNPGVTWVEVIPKSLNYTQY